MKRTFLNIFLILLPFLAFNQDYSIDYYNVNIVVMPDGTLQITEEIDAIFAEKKHGIIRNIPKQNHIAYLPDSLKSLRAEPSSTYFIKIYDVVVENFESEITENYHNLQIRIGSAEKYVDGKQKYIIKYKVSGIINPFNNHDEISWNIIGNEWDVTISKIDFEVILKKQLSISNDNIKLISGLKSQINNDAEFEIVENKIIGKSTKVFAPMEGMSIALKLPKNYIEKSYEINRIETNIIQNYNGSCTISDKFIIDFKTYQNGFIYKIPRKFIDQTGKEHSIYIKDKPKYNKNFYRIKEKETLYEIHLGGTIDTPMLKNNQEIEFTYEIWGNIYKKNNSFFMYWNFSSFDNKEKTTECKYTFRHSENIDFLTNNPIVNNLSLNISDKQIEGKTISNKKELSDILIQLKNNSVDEIPPIKIIRNATNYYIEKIHCNITVDKNKEVHLDQKMQFNFLNLYTKGSCFPFIYNITKSFFEDDYEYLPAKYIKTSRKTYFTKQYKPLYYSFDISNTQCVSNYNNELEISWLVEKDNPKYAYPHIKYSVYDIINSSDSISVISIPILTNSSEPVMETECIIELPAPFNLNEIDCELIRNDTLATKIESTQRGNKLFIKIPFLKSESTPFAILVKFPTDLIKETSYFLEFKLLIINNYFLLIPVLIFIILSIIWIIIGRNKKQSIIIRYEAPKGVTPAEAGLLWDNKLHKRDMVALFYYWAANKNLTILKDKDNKLSFRLLKRLDNKSKKFERTIFNKIFYSKKIGELVQLNTLKGSFTPTLKKAFRQMKVYSKNNKFYTPGTIGFGRFLIILSIFSIIASFIFFIVNLFFSQLVISLFTISVILFIFGKLMPKRAHLGNKIYYELVGFSEFIETAELDRLKKLTDENPDYFANTLAYAIVMGKAEKWAKKFEAIFNNTPSWYENNNSKHSAITFASDIINSMRDTEKSLSYIESSNTSYRNTSSSSWSGSSRFSNSSSNSFTSGSGFGGGGGSSW